MKTYSKILITFLLLFFSKNVSSQDIYFSTGLSTTNKIYRLNSDNSITLITEIPVTPPSFDDIAISPSGNFYGIKGIGEIYEIDIVTGTSNLLATLPNGGSYKSLVCSIDNELYTINNATKKLQRYNIQNNALEDVADLGYTTPGDLTFYEGNIIFPSFDTSLGTLVIKAFNLTNNNISNINCIPAGTPAPWGIANVYTECNANRVLTISSTGEICEYDFINDTRVCSNIDNIFAILGMASTNEYMASSCDSTDLNDLGCSNLSIGSTFEKEVKIYPNPANDLIKLKNITNINLIEIFDITGKKVKEVSNPNNEINIINLLNGLYFLKINSNNGIEIIKLIKK